MSSKEKENLRRRQVQNDGRKLIAAVNEQLKREGITLDTVSDARLRAIIREVVAARGIKAKGIQFDIMERKESKEIGSLPPKRQKGPLQSYWLPRPPRRPRHK